MDTIQIEYPNDFPDYALADSGDGEKLETVSGYTIIRPDPRAIWQKSDPGLWGKADAQFVRTSAESGHWNIRKPAPTPWRFHWNTMTLSLRPTDFKHIGVFPEQAVNWQWITEKINGASISVLNLFAYTGGATIAASLAGAFVTHVDSVKSAITWAHENARENAIAQNKIRWIEDDAYKFVQREAKRGKTYDAIIMDPPRFGRGPKGEVWKLEDDLPKLLSACAQILSPTPYFILINAYTADLSSIVLSNLLRDMTKGKTGHTHVGELTTKEQASGRFLPQGIFGRYERSL